MPIEVTIKLYEFHELSEGAKEVARQWWYESIETGDYESTIEDCDGIARDLGITLDRRSFKTVGGSTRDEPDIRWSGFSSQGDGASFNGTWKYPEWNIVSRIRDNCPEDLTLHSIARVMHSMYLKYQQHRDFQKLRVICKYSTSGVSYAHSGWMGVESELIDAEDAEESPEVDVSDEDKKIIKSTMRGFAGWIYEQLRKEDEYLHSDENVASAMEANGYTFEANGKRRDA